MHIYSDDRRSHLSLTPTDDAYQLSAHFQGDTYTFSANKPGVHLLHLDRFVADLTNFLQERSGRVILEGTEDCQIEFFIWNQKGEIGLSVQITHYWYGYDPLHTYPIHLSGSFKLDAEYLNTILNDCRYLAQHPPTIP